MQNMPSQIEIETPKGPVYIDIPAESAETMRRYPCKGCGKPIFFAKTYRGNNIPVSQRESDGKFESHFNSCSAVDKFPKKNYAQ